jgi:N-terminal acetyltransferase B complex catalytic subunit
VLGKVEGEALKMEWHGHVTAVTVAPECRKQGLAKLLMNYLERVSEAHHGYFVDLFVRASNNMAIEMYRKLGYNIYRTINKYYSSSLDESGEDAFGIYLVTQI